MAANWRLNTILGLTAFLLTYIFSYSNNMWQTSLFRACIGFLVFFLLGFVVRIVLNEVKIKKTSSTVDDHHTVEGSNIEQETNKHIEEVMEESFQQIPLHGLHKGDRT
ncbi:hypothetical protein [Neobacillus drentensis]|uniref:hypothetical protein n=1 Tax=Neobacillus drentensis TaxID=220684 RepID=UPI0030022841